MINLATEDEVRHEEMGTLCHQHQTIEGSTELMLVPVVKGQ